MRLPSKQDIGVRFPLPAPEEKHSIYLLIFYTGQGRLEANGSVWRGGVIFDIVVLYAKSRI